MYRCDINVSIYNTIFRSSPFNVFETSPFNVFDPNPS